MSDQTTLDPTTLEDVKTFAAALSPWAHLATVGAFGTLMPLAPV